MLIVSCSYPHPGDPCLPAHPPALELHRHRVPAHGARGGLPLALGGLHPLPPLHEPPQGGGLLQEAPLRGHAGHLGGAERRQPRPALRHHLLHGAADAERRAGALRPGVLLLALQGHDGKVPLAAEVQLPAAVLLQDACADGQDHRHREGKRAVSLAPLHSGGIFVSLLLLLQCLILFYFFVLQDVFAITGAFIGASNIPERWFPGSLDLLFNSHNFMHVLVVVAAYQMHLAVVNDLTWMTAIKEGSLTC